jgi:hypothetical protein
MASTLGKAVENLYQSDYIARKNASITYCRAPSYCNNITLANSYNQMNSYNLGAYVNSIGTCNIIPVNKTNLVASQYSKLNLQNICTVNAGPPPLQPFLYGESNYSCNSNPVIINPNNPTNLTATTPFYYGYTIDPVGAEFGVTPCGALNYTEYMVFYPPAPPGSPAFS